MVYQADDRFSARLLYYKRMGGFRYFYGGNSVVTAKFIHRFFDT
jgi:hypothetical protein